MTVRLGPECPRYLGVIHLPPLPGTPYWDPASWPRSIDDVREQVGVLVDGGMDGVLLQSSDRVYPTGDEADPGRVAALTRYAQAVADERPDRFLLGVQLLRNGVTASLAVARLTGADYVRAGALVGATLTTHGWVQPDAAAIMAHRKALDAAAVTLVTDISSTHFRWPGDGVSLADLAHKAALVGADAVIIDPAESEVRQREIAELTASAPQVPIVVGGHLSPQNVASARGASGAFVRGCLLGPDGRLSLDRVVAFSEAARS